jgi:anionic cell wall polymer biosynthesis LytR-Cps2A-Psr (LCP) family protein
MNVVIGIGDSHLLTDNLVFINFKEKSITWIPRDLYSFYLKKRINFAFKKGGHVLLLRALKKLGFSAQYSMYIPLQTTQKVLSDVKITVPMPYVADYYYPLEVFQPIENGKKIISFQPPCEFLEGERIHQFLGARYRVNSTDYLDFSDYERIMRQMLFIKQMLVEHFDFKLFLEYEYSISHFKVLELLSLVDASYRLKLYRNCTSIRYSGQQVLVRNGWSFWKLKIYRRINKIWEDVTKRKA